MRVLLLATSALVGALLAFLILYLFGGVSLLWTPPGPTPKDLVVKESGVVIIPVKPSAGAPNVEFVKSVKMSPHGVDGYSRVIVSGPTDPSSKVTSLVYELPLDEAEHLHRLTEELKASKWPKNVPLEFKDTAAKTLGKALIDAYMVDSDVEFRITIECWYTSGGKYLLSVEEAEFDIDIDFGDQ
jgi:hypothetical protein